MQMEDFKHIFIEFFFKIASQLINLLGLIAKYQNMTLIILHERIIIFQYVCIHDFNNL